jgi:Uma2 family endonuclease
MSIATLPGVAFPEHWTFADLQERLGGIPASRIRLMPLPGTATEDDLLRLAERDKTLCELIDGVLVEKTVGSFESAITLVLVQLMAPYLAQHPLGVLLGADGMLRLMPGRVRIPDVSFLKWSRFPNRRLPKDRVWSLSPDLAVEVLSDSNTNREIELKLDEYFQAGTQVAWIIDPERRTASLYRSRTDVVIIDENGLLDGGAVLPGFTLRLGELLDFLPR